MACQAEFHNVDIMNWLVIIPNDVRLILTCLCRFNVYTVETPANDYQYCVPYQPLSYNIKPDNLQNWENLCPCLTCHLVITNSMQMHCPVCRPNCGHLGQYIWKLTWETLLHSQNIFDQAGGVPVNVNSFVKPYLKTFAVGWPSNVKYQVYSLLKHIQHFLINSQYVRQLCCIEKLIECPFLGSESFDWIIKFCSWLHTLDGFLLSTIVVLRKAN